MTDQEAFVDRLSQMTKDGGYLILTVQNKFVYERRAEIPPPAVGNVRKWLTGRQLKGLLEPRFAVIKSTTVLPDGHLGILRYINSPKLNGLLGKVIPPRHLRRAKERLGFGQTIVVLARRRDPRSIL